MPQELNFLAIVKDTGYRFIFYYDDAPESRTELFRQFGRWADHPDLDFTWRDAALLSQAAGRGPEVLPGLTAGRNGQRTTDNSP